MKKHADTSSRNATARSSSGRLVGRPTKHKMARFRGGWNYRGYCVYRKYKGNVGCLWQMADECGEWTWFFHTLSEFRRQCDRWERQRAKEAAQTESSPNNDLCHGKNPKRSTP